MAINAVKKIMNGDTPLASAAIDTGTISTAKLGASAVTAAKVAASAIVANGLKYKKYNFSFAGGGSGGPGPGTSAIFSCAVTVGTTMIGWYFTSIVVTSTASYGPTPKFDFSTSAGVLTVTPTPLLGTAADLQQGVVICIEP